MNENELMRLVRDIIAAHVANNPVPSDELPDLIRRTKQSLMEIHSVSAPDAGAVATAPQATAPQAPAPRQATTQMERTPEPVPAESIPEVTQAEPAAPQEPVAPQKPAVPINKSVTPDFIYCLEDGAPKKMLKRYLRAQFGLTPEEYRAKWGLPKDYPMVAPSYAKEKSSYAKHVGLGTPKLGRPDQPTQSTQKATATKRKSRARKSATKSPATA